MAFLVNHPGPSHAPNVDGRRWPLNHRDMAFLINRSPKVRVRDWHMGFLIDHASSSPFAEVISTII